MKLTERSTLRLRVPSRMLADLMCLMGTTLEMDGDRVRLGNPQIEPLQATPRLFSPWVTLKEAEEPGVFVERLAQDFERMEISGSFGLVAPKNQGSKDGGKGSRVEYIRRTRAIKGHAIVGFALMVQDLSEEESLRLQAEGIGGRRHFGGGLFRPAKGR